MLDAAETTELRALQARAYGRDGGLTDAEAARLRELEGATRLREPEDPGTRTAADLDARAGTERATHPSESHRGAPAEHAPERTAPPEPRDAAPQAETGDHPIDAGSSAHSSTGPASAPERLRPLLRRRWRTAVIGAVAIAAAGVGLGWLLFGDHDAQAVELTAAQRAWQSELLADAEYDAGSVRAIAEHQGVVAWYATKRSGERACLILSDGENSRPSCTMAARMPSEGLHAQIDVADGDEQRQVTAQVLLDAEGDPAALMSSYIIGEELVTRYATEEEAAIAERLTEHGFDPGMLWMLGFDGEVPLWTGALQETQQQCLMYNGSVEADQMACGDSTTLWNEGGVLVIERTDEVTGEATRYEQVFRNGGTTLVITRQVGAGDAGG